MGKYKVHGVWAVAVVVALVGGIFWGKSMAGGATGAASSGRFANASSSARAAFASRNGGGLVAGQVASVNGSNITLQLANGNSEVVFFSSSTAVTEPQTVSASKIAQGANVVVMGTQNSDGSMTASSIQVGGAGGFRGGGGGAAAQ